MEIPNNDRIACDQILTALFGAACFSEWKLRTHKVAKLILEFAILRKVETNNIRDEYIYFIYK